MDMKDLITTLGIRTVVSFNFPLPMDKPLDMSRFHDRASIDIWTKDPEQQKAVKFIITIITICLSMITSIDFGYSPRLFL